jgi:hypothetical protein
MDRPDYESTHGLIDTQRSFQATSFDQISLRNSVLRNEIERYTSFEWCSVGMKAHYLKFLVTNALESEI